MRHLKLKCTAKSKHACVHVVGQVFQSYVLVSCTLTVVEESPEATAVEMIQDCQQEALIKFKGRRELRGEERRGEELTSYKSQTASFTSDLRSRNPLWWTGL